MQTGQFFESRGVISTGNYLLRMATGECQVLGLKLWVATLNFITKAEWPTLPGLPVVVDCEYALAVSGVRVSAMPVPETAEVPHMLS